MADSNVSDTTKYYMENGTNASHDTYNFSTAHNCSNGLDKPQNSTYNFNQDVSNNFLGQYHNQNGYLPDSSVTLQYKNNNESDSYVGHQMTYNSTSYADFYQYQNHTDQSTHSELNSDVNDGTQQKYHNSTDSNHDLYKYQDRQVNSQNYYPQSDENHDKAPSNDNDRKLDSPLNDHETNHYDRPDKMYSDIESREYRDDSEDSRESYRKKSHRSRHRSSRSYRRSSESYHRRRSRSPSHRHRRRSRSHRRSDKYYKRHRRYRSRSRSRRREYRDSRDYSDYRESRDNREPSQTEREVKDLGLDIMEKAKMLRSNEIEKRRMKDIEEAQRDDLTVLVANISLSADERDIYELFSEHAGKVRDIQCVRDSRSGRSKGIAYVEFYTQEAVIKALSMTGMSLKGQGIRVQSSQAEKNRAAKAAKQVQDNVRKESDNPTTIVVSNLLGILSHLNESELQQLFSPFGNITDVTVVRDDNGESKGYAYIRFKRWNEAKEALNVMNGFDISGQQIKVSYATFKKDSKSRLNALGDLELERLDDDDAGLISGSNVKIALMKKLQQRQPYNSSNIVLSNMYTKEDYSDNPEFFDEIEEDVREECNKYGKVVQVYLNRKNPEGKVYVKFKTYNDAHNAYKSLQGRYFAGNTINVSHISDDQFQSLTGAQ